MNPEPKDVVFLEVENILDVNEKIRLKSLEKKTIEYGGFDEFPIRMNKLKELIKHTPKDVPLEEMAAFYLKNLILLQPFADGNHRTALLCADLFLRKNGFSLVFEVEDAVRFQKKFYGLRFKLYQTYEELGIFVLKEEPNDALDYCLTYIKEHLTKRG